MKDEIGPCYICGSGFKPTQIIFEVKLDTWEIVKTHGGDCAAKAGGLIRRISIKEPDWWIRKIGVAKIELQCNEVLVLGELN